MPDNHGCFAAGVVRRVMLTILLLPSAGWLAAQQSPVQEIEALKREVAELRRRDEAREAELARLKTQVEALLQAAGGKVGQPAPPVPAPAAGAEADRAALDAALAEAPAPAAAPVPIGAPPPLVADRSSVGSALRLVDVSLDVLMSAGGSSLPDDELAGLQSGGHDPNQRGFNFQQAEVSLAGAVDPYLNAEAHLVYRTDGVELEEAFGTTQALPAGLQLKAGYFLSEFGRVNPTHPHAWTWLDQPVVATRLFGPEGMRAAGARLGWLMPLPWYSEVQVTLQNAGGDTMPSFLSSAGGGTGHVHSSAEKGIGRTDTIDALLHEDSEESSTTGIGGRPLVERDVASLGDFAWMLRWKNAGSLSPSVSAQWGISAMTGPNATGPTGRTWLYGTDLVMKWRPVNNRRGWPFLTWETELMGRQYRADAYSDDDDPAAIVDLPGETLRDWGFYTQWVYGFRYLWSAGLRLDYDSGCGESVGGREADPLRDNRFRLSPLLVWQFSEYSRLRFQYNFDRADHLEGRDAHTIWVGLEFLIGAHPAHQY